MKHRIFAAMITGVTLMLTICMRAAIGESVPEAYLRLSPVLSENLTEQDIGKIILESDMTNEYLGCRWITYSYDGIKGITFKVYIQDGETEINDDEYFIKSLRACQSAPVGMEEAEAAAVRYFSEFLAEQEEDPAYQAYTEHFGLDRITVSECLFVPSFSVYGDDPVWGFQIYPVRANDEVEADYDHEDPFPFLQWAWMNVDGTTGEIAYFEFDSFTQMEGLHTDEFAGEIREILQRDTADFSMYTFRDSGFLKEYQMLYTAESLISAGEPIERFCPGVSHGEAVFRIYARHILMTFNISGKRDGISTRYELEWLTWHPDAMEYGRTREPEIYSTLFSDLIVLPAQQQEPSAR